MNLPNIPALSREDLPALNLIARSNDLKKLVDVLAQERIIAVDTESNSLYAYYEKVCLIQFSTAQTDYLVDPLAVEDLSPLRRIFANPKIEKIFHASEYDLICLRRDYGFQFANLFDTMLAASLLGRDEVGLGAILGSEFGIQIDKHYQRANWGQRPLPPHLLAYARLDTHYLIPLRNRLKEDLERTDRWPLAEEDFKRLCLVSNRLAENGTVRNAEIANGNCWRIKGARDLDPQQAAVLQELNNYRDQTARGRDLPVFKVIGDATLLAIATACPASLPELKQIKGMTDNQVRRHGRALLEAVHRGLKARPIRPKRNQRPDDQYLSRLEALRQWRKATAQEIEVKSDMVLPRDIMQELAAEAPQTRKALRAIMRETPWRYKHFGEQILKVLVH